MVALWSSLSLMAWAEDQPLPLNPAVRSGKFANGLTYYLQKNTKPEKRVELRLAVNAGSVQEDDDQRGLAHFVEHVMFRGTKSFPGDKLIHYLQSVGASFGPHVNAYTSFDETVYMLSIPSDKPEVLANGLTIMREWAGEGATFTDEDIQKERGVVIEEWRIGRGPQQRMMDRALPLAFGGSKYGQRIPIGTHEILESATPDRVRSFYQDWYRPDLMALIVVGDFDPQAMEETIKTQFGTIARLAKVRPRESYTVPENADPIFAIESDRENPNSQMILAFKTPFDPPTTVPKFRRTLGEQIFIRLTSARLQELTQKPNPPFVYSKTDYGPMGVRPQPAYFAVAVTSENGLPAAFTALLTENERVARHGFTESELQRGKKDLLKQLEQQYLERDKTESASLASAYVGHFLASQPAPGPEFEYQFAKEHLDSVSLEELRQISVRWLGPKNRVFLVQSVEKPSVKIPSEAELVSAAKAVAASEITPYAEKQLAGSLLAEKPTPGKAVSQKQFAEAGVTELTLSNGARVVLKPSSFQNDEIIFSAFRPGGQSVFPEAYHLSTLLASDYIADAGVAGFSKTELQKMLAGKTVTVSPRLEPCFDTVKGKSSRADLEALLQLTYLYFTQPRRDEDAYTSFLSRQRATMDNLRANPMYSFMDTAQRIRYAEHKRVLDVLPRDEDWATVNLDRIMEIYQSRFSDASGYTFFLVGSFDLPTVQTLVETYLGGLPAKQASVGYRDLGLRSIVGPVRREVRLGVDPKSLVILSQEQPTAWDQDDEHLLWSFGNILQRLLTDRLRKEMGGVYGIGVQLHLEKHPFGHATLELQVPCAPENVQKLIDATNEEVRKVQRDGVKPEDLVEETEFQRRMFDQMLKENGTWQWSLETIYRNGEDFRRVTNPEGRVALVTSDNIRRVASRYADTGKWVQVTLYPENK